LNNDDESMHWIIATQADISIEANYQKDKVYVVRHNNDSQNPHVSKLESVLQLQSETAREILKTQCGNDIRRCSDLQLSVLNSLKLMKAEYLQNTSSYREAYNATPTALLPEPSVFYVSQSLQVSELSTCATRQLLSLELNVSAFYINQLYHLHLTTNYRLEKTDAGKKQTLLA